MFVAYCPDRPSDCYEFFNPKTLGKYYTRDVTWLHQMYFGRSSTLKRSGRVLPLKTTGNDPHLLKIDQGSVGEFITPAPKNQNQKQNENKQKQISTKTCLSMKKLKTKRMTKEMMMRQKHKAQVQEEEYGFMKVQKVVYKRNNKKNKKRNNKMNKRNNKKNNKRNNKRNNRKNKRNNRKRNRNPFYVQDWDVPFESQPDLETIAKAMTYQR